MDSDPSRPLPNAIEAEWAVLSCMMQDEANRFLTEAAEKGITPTYFYVPAHGTLFGVLQELHKSRKPIEILSLSQDLADRGLLENMGGRSALTKIYTWMPTSANFAHHLQIVRSKHLARQIIQNASKAIARTMESDDPEQVIAELARAVSKLQDDVEVGDGSQSAEMIVAEVLEEISTRLEGKNTTVIPTPWWNLNKAINGGIGMGEITIIAARPSMGKTALFLNLLEQAAIKEAIPTLLLSVESSTLRLGYRILSQHSGVVVSRLAKEKLDLLEIESTNRSGDVLRKKPFWIQKLHRARHGDLTRSIRSEVRRHGIKMVGIDYLQLIKASNQEEQASERLRLNNALDAICPLADELNIALVILAQLNRVAEGKPASKLNLGMLKETGRIEQDADLILMIGDAHDHKATQENCQARTILIAKNRDGPTTLARLQFHGETTRFLAP
jgi:replicative DNA helicase